MSLADSINALRSTSKKQMFRCFAAGRQVISPADIMREKNHWNAEAMTYIVTWFVLGWGRLLVRQSSRSRTEEPAGKPRSTGEVWSSAANQPHPCPDMPA